MMMTFKINISLLASHLIIMNSTGHYFFCVVSLLDQTNKPSINVDTYRMKKKRKDK
jgi:hypothetical protein